MCSCSVGEPQKTASKPASTDLLPIPAHDSTDGARSGCYGISAIPHPSPICASEVIPSTAVLGKRADATLSTRLLGWRNGFLRSSSLRLVADRSLPSLIFLV